MAMSIFDDRKNEANKGKLPKKYFEHNQPRNQISNVYQIFIETLNRRNLTLDDFAQLLYLPAKDQLNYRSFIEYDTHPGIDILRKIERVFDLPGGYLVGLAELNKNLYKPANI